MKSDTSSDKLPENSSDVSRRTFLKGIGVAGIAAGMLGFSSNMEEAFADEATGTAAASSAENEYLSIFSNETNLLPVNKAVWPVKGGPIGYEGREIAASEIIRTDGCDVLIIGAGVSGIMASLKALEEGASVITIEKMSKGRNMWESIGGYNTSSQKEIDNVPDPAQYVEEIIRAGDWRVRPDVVWSFVNNSGETIDFMQKMINKSDWEIKIQNTVQPPSPYGFVVIQGEHKFLVAEKHKWTSWVTGPAVMSALTAVAQGYQNMDLRHRTSGVQLVQDSAGRVTGAIVKDDEGYYQINASKGVLLATGSYHQNPRMVEAWTRPEDYASSSCWDPSQGPTGDGHMMGLKIGAQMDPVPHSVMNFCFGTPASFLDIPGIFTVAFLGIHVSKAGKRFVNEGLQMNFKSNAINALPDYGKGSWIIFDQMAMDIASKDNPVAEDTIKKYTERGWLFKGETLADLARTIDMDAASLEETVATYNSYYQADPPIDLEFRRDLTGSPPLLQGPYWAITTQSTVLAVTGGLMINQDAQVLDNANNVIEGLYAAGNASGGMFSGTYPRHLPATSVGRAATFGFVAARHMLKGGQS